MGEHAEANAVAVALLFDLPTATPAVANGHTVPAATEQPAAS